MKPGSQSETYVCRQSVTNFNISKELEFELPNPFNHHRSMTMTKETHEK